MVIKYRLTKLSVCSTARTAHCCRENQSCFSFRLVKEVRTFSRFQFLISHFSLERIQKHDIVLFCSLAISQHHYVCFPSMCFPSIISSALDRYSGSFWCCYENQQIICWVTTIICSLELAVRCCDKLGTVQIGLTSSRWQYSYTVLFLVGYSRISLSCFFRCWQKYPVFPFELMLQFWPVFQRFSSVWLLPSVKCLTSERFGRFGFKSWLA